MFPKLYLAASTNSLRGNVRQMLVTKKHCVVTDSTVMVVWDTAKLFDNYLANACGDKEYHIGYDDLKALSLAKWKSWSFNQDEMTITLASNKHEKRDVKLQNGRDGFPNWDVAIPESLQTKSFELEQIGVDPLKLYNLSQAMSLENGEYLNLAFVAENKPICVSVIKGDVNHVYGIIMPVLTSAIKRNPKFINQENEK